MLERIIFVAIILTFGVFFTSLARADVPTIALSWEHPVEREDGAALALSEIDGYRLYWNSGIKSGVLEIPLSTEYNFFPEGVGIYLFQISTVDSDMQEGKKSPVLSVDIKEQSAMPNAPTLLSGEFDCVDCGLIQEGAN